MAETTELSDSSAGVCPWCSAAVTTETVTCPSCHAILITDQEHDLPGVTAIDESIVRARPEKPPQQSRGRFLSWFGSEQPASTTSEADAQAIAPPDEDVQREILRLQIEADISNLQAEADSILSDALVEGRIDDLPEDLRPLLEAEAAAETPAETADALVEAATEHTDTEPTDTEPTDTEHTDADPPDAETPA